MSTKSTSWLAIAGLAIALALPAAARQSQQGQQVQQNQSSATQATVPDQQSTVPSAQPAASSTAQEQQDIDKATQVQSQPLQAQTHEGFWGHLNPFARKKYVNKQLQPVRSRINELDELTADNSKQISRVDSESRAGIAAAQSRADQANQQASAAEQQAQDVSSKAQQLDQQVSTVQTTVQNVDQYQVAQTAQINFRRGSAHLNSAAQQSLNQFLAGLDNQKGYIVEVQAYSAGRGRQALDNSQRLADTVVRYLVLQHNVPLYRIYTVGLGNAPVQASNAAAVGHEARLTRGGRVDIRILHNDLASMGGQPASNPATSQPQQQQQPPL